jgi:hypothetical protein
VSAPRATATSSAWVHAPQPEMQASRGQSQLHPLFPPSPAVRNNVTCKAKKTPQTVDLFSVLDLLLFFAFYLLFFSSSLVAYLPWRTQRCE